MTEEEEPLTRRGGAREHRRRGQMAEYVDGSGRTAEGEVEDRQVRSKVTG